MLSSKWVEVTKEKNYKRLIFTNNRLHYFYYSFVFNTFKCLLI